VSAVVGPGTAIAYARGKSEIVTWYSGLSGPTLARRQDLLAFLAGPPPRAAVGRPRDFGPPAEWPAGTRIVAEGKIGDTALIVVRRDAAPPSPDR
jgi:hypothetical protein